MLRGLPHQPDGQHLTPEGYRMLAESLLPQVTGALGR
jgi:acyl-CoA thioesterase-1